MKPLAIDLFCGLGGWTEGLLAEGYSVVGFDIERHVYGEKQYPAQLVIQDVLTIHGSQFEDAALIVASPPCQEYSYMAMPWSRAKNIAAEYRSGVRDVAKLNALFNACFRIQKEACEAAGHFIPLVVENVRGAQPWVGRARWNYGSFYLWGDVPAIMPFSRRIEFKGDPRGYQPNQGSWFGISMNDVRRGTAGVRAEGRKVPGMNFHDYAKTGKPGRSFQSAAVLDTFGWSKESEVRRNSSHSPARKAASAEIAKIPLPLARHIARTYLPVEATA